MIELLFKEEALVDLQRFVRNYEQAFFELYKDSGVWNEDLIIQSYRESANKLYSTILEKIEKRLAPEKVIGRKTSQSWQELYFYVDNRLVIVHYSEDKKGRLRLVESIAIDRKPIIF